MPLSFDDEDEDVRIAVRALGDMRNSAIASSSTTPIDDPDRSDFKTRVSHLPLVNTALRAYEQGKNSSRVVKYGAQIVESSIQNLSKPVIDRLPSGVDEFACRQLDRLDKYRREPDSSTSTELRRRDSSWRSIVGEDERTRSVETSVPRWLEANTSDTRSHSRSTSPGYGYEYRHDDNDHSEHTRREDDHQQQQPQQQQVAIVQRSRWQAVLSEAGGIGAAFSEESMRRLKYCLQWLQYATEHIDAQILVLRDFIATLQPLPTIPRSHSHASHPISQAHMRTLTDVRRDIVHTIRQVVDVVSKYAGGALPEPARTRVRGFILKLPQRWASKAAVATASGGEETRERERDMESVAAAAGSGAGAIQRRGNRRLQHHRERGTGSESASASASTSTVNTSRSRQVSPSRSSSSRAASPMRSPAQIGSTNGGVPVGTAMVAAQRILTLATESLDMMRGVTGVVKDSLDRADTWVGRLQTVGIQRRSTDDDPHVRPHPSNITTTTNEDEFPRGRRSTSRFDGLKLPSPSPSSYPSTPYSSYSSFGGHTSSVPGTPAPGAQSPGLGLGLGGICLSGNANGNGAGMGAYGVPRNVLGDEVDEDESRDEGSVVVKQEERGEDTMDVDG